jgi:WD40 repeat protein
MPPDRPTAPTPETLRRFLTGELSEPELEAVSRYLNEHPAAAADLDATFHVPAAGDPLLAALRDSSGMADLDAPELGELIARFQTPPVGPTATPVTDGPQQAEPELQGLGGYRLIRVLGRGGMGVVYEAEDSQLGRRVALKVLSAHAAREPGARDRFLREARLAAAVEHDHITPVFHVGEDQGLPFMAMSLLHGETLEARLRAGPVPLPESVLIARQAAEGLAAAHARGLVHRDVKPSNIWLERHSDGTFKRVRLLDFGLAKPLAPTDVELTRSGVVMGTPAYMAPEQARGLPTDHRADLFSLGVVLYRMTTGVRPFDGADAFAVLTALVVDTPRAPAVVNPEVPPELSDLVMRLLEKDPGRRPQSAQVVAEELAAIAAGVPANAPMQAPRQAAAVPMPAGSGQSGGASSLPGAAPPRRRPGWLVPAVVVVVLVLGAAGAFYGVTISRFLLGRGELLIEADDPGVEVAVQDAGGGKHERVLGGPLVLPNGEATVTFTDPSTRAVLLTRTVGVPRSGAASVRVTAAELAAARLRANSARINNGPTDRPRFPVIKTDGWLALSPDGRLLAVPLDGGNPEVWVFNTATARIERKLTGMTWRALRSAFTPDGRRLVTANVFQKEAVVWNLDTGEKVNSFPYEEECVSVAVRPGGKQVALGGGGGVRVYDLQSGRELHSLAMPGTVHGVAYSPAGDRLAAASDARTVRVCDADTGAEVRTIELPDDALGVAFSPDGRRLAAGGHRLLRVWEVGTWNEILARDDVPAVWVAFGSDPNLLWTGAWAGADQKSSNRPRRWDLGTGTATELATPSIPAWASFALSPDGTVLFVADTYNGVWVCDPATGLRKVVPPGSP